MVKFLWNYFSVGISLMLVSQNCARHIIGGHKASERSGSNNIYISLGYNLCVAFTVDKHSEMDRMKPIKER